MRSHKTRSTREVSHAACKDEFRRNPRSHTADVFSLKYRTIILRVFPGRVGVCVCSLRYTRCHRFFYLPIDIQHIKCQCRFFILERYKLCGHKLRVRIANTAEISQCNDKRTGCCLSTSSYSRVPGTWYVASSHRHSSRLLLLLLPLYTSMGK